MTFSTRRFGVVLAIAILAAALSACGGSAASVAPSPTTVAPPSDAPTVSPSEAASPSETASPTETATTPGASLATTGRIEIPDRGIAVTLPDGWNRIDLGAGDLAALMAAAGDLDPVLAEQYTAQIQAMISAGLALFAFGPDPSSGQNVTILAIPGLGLSLDLIEQLNSSQIGAIAEGEVKSERVTLPAGEAIHFQYEITADALGGAAALDQYLLLAGDNQLVVTITAATPAEGAAIANSIEVLE